MLDPFCTRFYLFIVKKHPSVRKSDPVKAIAAR